MAEALKIDDWKNPLGAPDAKTALGSTTEPTKPATPDKTESPKPGGVIAASSEIGKGAEEASRKIAAYEAEAGKLTPPQLKPVPPPTPKVTNASPSFGAMQLLAHKGLVRVQPRKVEMSVRAYASRSSGLEGRAVRSLSESREVGVELGRNTPTVSSTRLRSQLQMPK